MSLSEIIKKEVKGIKNLYHLRKNNSVYREWHERCPWLDNVVISDHGFADLFLKDSDERQLQAMKNLNAPYNRLAVEQMKYFYQTGEYRTMGHRSIDDRLTEVCDKIKKQDSFKQRIS